MAQPASKKRKLNNDQSLDQEDYDEFPPALISNNHEPQPTVRLKSRKRGFFQKKRSYKPSPQENALELINPVPPPAYYNDTLPVPPPAYCASVKQLYTHKAITPEQFFCDPIYQLSELKNMKSICFNCRANITHIKYKNNCNLKDYCMPINTIQKRFKFTWYITSLLINKCYNMGWQQPIYSHNFDNNNWCLVLFPDGYYSKGRSEMFLKCLYMPYNVNSMQVKFTFDINGKSIEITYNFDHHKNANGKHFMPFSQFKQESSLSVSLTLQIIKVFDKNNVIIEQNDWGKFGINPMIQIENIQSGILL
eukprot:393017_1